MEDLSLQLKSAKEYLDLVLKKQYDLNDKDLFLAKTYSYIINNAFIERTFTRKKIKFILNNYKKFKDNNNISIDYNETTEEEQINIGNTTSNTIQDLLQNIFVYNNNRNYVISEPSDTNSIISLENINYSNTSSPIISNREIQVGTQEETENSTKNITNTYIEEDDDVITDFIYLHKKYLQSEIIPKNKVDSSCLSGNKKSEKRTWMKKNCKHCKSIITLENFKDEDYDNIVSIKILNGPFKIKNKNKEKITYRFSKGNCLLRNEVVEIVKSQKNGKSYDYIFSLYLNVNKYKGDIDISGKNSYPFGNLVFKLNLQDTTIFITLSSLHKLIKYKDNIFYAIPLYNGKRRRIGNIIKNTFIGNLNGEVPGYKVYTLVTKKEYDILRKSKYKTINYYTAEESGSENFTDFKIKPETLFKFITSDMNLVIALIINSVIDKLLDEQAKEFKYEYKD